MKLHQLALSAITALLISGCDKIEGPYGTNNGGGPIGGDTIVQNVLLEDFTGHTCQACPNAHREATRLHDIYGDRLIILALHADFWADPYPAGAPYFTYDFRNPTATAIATDFNVIGQPFPKGMVHRMLNPGTSDQLILDWAGWESKVDQWINTVAKDGIEISTSYDNGTKNITADIDLKVVSDLTDPVSLAVYFVEDSIVNWQKDGSTNVQNYIHRHVLRGSLNGTYGEDLGPLTAGTELTKSYTGQLIPADADAAHIYIVAILTNNVTKEVIQVEEVKLQ